MKGAFYGGCVGLPLFFHLYPFSCVRIAKKRSDYARVFFGVGGGSPEWVKEGGGGLNLPLCTQICPPIL